MIIHRHLTQGSSEWFAARMGHVCSSEFSRVCGSDGAIRTGRKKGREWSEGVYTYAAAVASERITGVPANPGEFRSQAMEFASTMEPAARAHLAMLTDLEVVAIGGIESDCRRHWASTDGIVEDGDKLVAVAEIKIPTPSKLAYYHAFPDEFWEEYAVQVAMEIALSGAPVGYLYAYAPDMRALLRKVTADDPVVAAVRESLAKFDEIVRKIEAEAAFGDQA